MNIYTCTLLLSHCRIVKTSISIVYHYFSRHIFYFNNVLAAAAVKSHRVISDSVRPQTWQPTRLPRPWDSPGKNTGVGCHFLLQCLKVKCESEVAQSCPTLSELMDCSLPPLSMGSSRQEYWSGVPLPSPGEH